MTTELAPAPGATFTCSSCGESFTEKEAAVACDNCVTRGGCGMLRCPRCGFEQTRTPAFLGRLLNLFRRLDADNFQTVVIERKEDIWPSFRAFLSKDRAKLSETSSA